ncbi:MAG: SLC13 family permease [Dehalococcoidia bacterium]|nr:SLC13 family permease [Dehalococcoidia bacterium]
MGMDIIIVLIILIATAFLLILDKIRIDVVAILCMLALAWTGILQPLEALSSFSSNAVITMIAVMIMGRGIARTGVMAGFARLVLKYAGNSRRRVVATVSTAAGLMSGFIQNIGAAVLFLPAILNISRRIKIPASNLIMPIGFAILLSASLTMIGSAPLMMVNDFLAGSSLESYSLFAVTPVGLALLFSCVLFFFFLGRYVLPRYEYNKYPDILQAKLVEDWELSANIWHYRIKAKSTIVGKSVEETGIWDKYNLNILAITADKTSEYAPWRETRFEAGQIAALLGSEANILKFAADYDLVPIEKPKKLELLDNAVSAGFAEVVVLPRSAIAGQTIRKFGLRRRYGVEPVLLFHRGEKVRGNFSDIEITPGDIFIVHGLWDRITDFKKGYDFVVITPVEADEKDTSRAWIALLCFAISIGLAVAGFSIPISFMSGAIIMVLAGVLRIDEAYQAIDWKVVFFLAGLIPLGLAMQKTGTAAFLAGNVISLVQGSNIFLILLAISALTTLLSLFMSNVGAAVILFPIVISIAGSLEIDPRPLALLVAVSTANSFILPTHQVNALLKTPGGYRNIDYLKAGGGLTVIFLLVVTSIFYFFYL